MPKKERHWNSAAINCSCAWKQKRSWKLDTTHKLLGEVSETVRSISHSLMPIALEKYGLKAAIQDLITSIQTSGKMTVEDIIEGLDDTGDWSQEVVLGIYRIIQEVLNNVIKHAGATHVLVQVIELEDAVTIYVEDNGQGFVPDTEQDGLGMRLLKSNVEYLNGKIEIDGKPNTGAFVLVELQIR